MSFTWRCVVRLDGSFTRIGNLDHTSDEELARLRRERADDEQPGWTCSR